MYRAVWRALLGAVAAAVCGCSSVPTPVTADVPPDFAISVTVVDREGDSRPSLSRALRPARYIIEPDWVLRASVGPGSATTTYPPAMRTLTQRQMAQVWQAVEGAAYLATDPRRQIANTETRAPAVVRPTALVYVCAKGQRRSLQIPLDQPDAGPTRALVDRLAGLAWVAQ